MEPQPVTLRNLASGAVEELFDEELQNVLRNIADPNTDPETAREITIKVRIKPDEERQLGGVTVGVTSKLAAFKRVKTVIFMPGRQGQKYVAVESNPKQLTLEAPDNLVPLKGGKQ